VTKLQPGERLESGYYRNLMSRMYIEFDITRPADEPKDEDRVALAGIHDRLEYMRNRFTSPVTIHKGGEATTWTAGPTLTVPTGFFALSPLKQVEDALTALIKANDDISADHRRAFVEIVLWIKQGLGDPV
jgi:hypothetical protein